VQNKKGGGGKRIKKHGPRAKLYKAADGWGGKQPFRMSGKIRKGKGKKKNGGRHLGVPRRMVHAFVQEEDG